MEPNAAAAIFSPQKGYGYSENLLGINERDMCFLIGSERAI